MTRGRKALKVPADQAPSPDPPFPVERPMLYQDWRDCAFLHWDYDPSLLERHVPRGFLVETFEQRAWVSLISFRISRMRPGFLPPIPGLESAIESHLRTYVQGPDGRRGIWMLSLDIAPMAAAVLGRLFTLPYWWSSMDVRRRGKVARYAGRRRAPGRGRLRLEVELGDPIDDADLTELDHFLTARWVLYAGVSRFGAAYVTEHPRWRFLNASVRKLDQDLLREAGLPAPERPPTVHFSEGVDARLSWPRLFLTPSG